MTDAPFPGPKGPFAFELSARCGDTDARRGRVRTPHGSFPTPAFMPVGTAASVKGVHPDDVSTAGSRILLCNTYHLALRPGDDLIRDLGGLHRFMGWDGPILTDSGGYQVFSLGELTDVSDHGVTFRNHIDGRYLELGPDRAMEIQLNLGSDIIMAFDECLPADASEETVAESLERRTLPWTRRCLELHPDDGRALFAIIQGGLFPAQRERCVEALVDLPFEGFALGGLSVGEDPETLRAILSTTTPLLPAEKPRYLMGVGTVPEIIDAVASGVDMFDCVLPTRNARNAWALTPKGPLRLRNSRFTRDDRPLDENCACSTCRRGFSRAYLRHLDNAKELLGPTLMSVHNLHFMQVLMQELREALEAGSFAAWRRETLARWNGSEG